MPIYTELTVLFYRREKYPELEKTTVPNATRPYRYCGLFGYDYKAYRISESQLDSGAKTQQALFAKLRLDRCDFVLGAAQHIRRLGMSGQLDLTGLAHINIPGAKAKQYHVMVSRKRADGLELIKVINEGIALSKANGDYVKILKKYNLQGSHAN
jgi:polar amino acid transport system substrate-binding protein